MVDFRRYLFALLTQCSCNSRNPFCDIDQQILHGCHIGFLPAYAGHSAALAPSGFLTLIAKHFLFHIYLHNENIF